MAAGPAAWQPAVAADWVPVLTTLEYDPGLRPFAAKRGALCGMALTEKQGGSDLRANQTRAEPCGARGPGEAYRLPGHTRCCAAPRCAAMLALRPGGLAC